MTKPFSPADLARLARPVPRYTSYPTAPHFQEPVTAETYKGWITAIPAGKRVSLYVHIPFCDTLCWFCGCHTRMIRRYEPVKGYLEALYREIDTIGALMPEGVSVSHIHWGGGSPTMLTPEDMGTLCARLKAAFPLAADCEFAVEIDPRGMDDARLDALVAGGLTRASIGVQDFDTGVQKAINRFQSFEETEAVVRGLRARGVNSLNVDMLYGLPHQSPDVMMHSLEQVLSLKPDRLALFGYAHVPWMKKHQQMIEEQALPAMPDRVESATRAADRLVEAGYHRIGIDHFALPGDSLAVAAAEGTLRRNFQGYTQDDSDCLIGLGASSIGQLDQGFVQNETSGQAYVRRISEEGLAPTRGLLFTGEDKLRAAVIEDLMCNLRFDEKRMQARFGDAVAPLAAEAEVILFEEEASWLVRTETGFHVTEEGRPFLRLVAARFDAYLPRGAGRHSSAL